MAMASGPEIDAALSVSVPVPRSEHVGKSWPPQ